MVFNDYVQPVCLPSSDDPIYNTDGVVVGWGQSESQSFHETRPKYVKLTSVDQAKCLFDDPIFARISSVNMFCAGTQGVNPCKGDSGSGFFAKKGSKFSINGVVSSAVHENCADNKYSVFTSVTKYIFWIKNQIDEDKRDWSLIKINCQYEYNKDDE
jgi:secreted trypsin-like serine protease